MRVFLLLCSLAVGWFGATVSLGQQAPPPEAEDAAVVNREGVVYYGLGVRMRGLFVPQGVFEQFVDIAPSGIRQPEVGLELLRRRGYFEAALGVAWAPLSTDEGIWLTDFGDLDDHPSYVEYDGFSWLSVDLNAAWTYPLRQTVGLRYGLGVGLGFLMGEVLETDYICPASRFELDMCRQAEDAVDVREPIALPPFIPLTNAFLGIQYTPSEWVALNLEGGIHTALFAGLGVHVYFR